MGESPVERRRLTFGRLVGVDRSGPPPPETLPGAPLNLWTIPNAIGMVRLGLLPIFLAVSFSSDSGIPNGARLSVRSGPNRVLLFALWTPDMIPVPGT